MHYENAVYRCVSDGRWQTHVKAADNEYHLFDTILSSSSNDSRKELKALNRSEPDLLRYNGTA